MLAALLSLVISVFRIIELLAVGRVILFCPRQSSRSLKPILHP
jgi:hypothetical protein